MQFKATLLFLLFLPFTTLAKKHALSQYDYFNGDAFWQNLIVVPDGGPMPWNTADPAIIVASNRKPAPGQLRFMSEHRDPDSLRFYCVVSHGDKWYIKQVPGLRKAVSLNQLPGADPHWVVYTEGMGKIFTSDLDRAIRMTEQYKVKVILLDYPSIRTDKGAFRNYYFAKGNAAKAFKDFVPVLDTLHTLKKEGQLGNSSLCLFFHSMGNKVAREMMLHRAAAYINGDTWVDNLVLNAPCVSQKNHRRWVEQIGFARHIYVHYNPEDATLKWARLLSLHKQLGDHVRRPVSDVATYINFNTLCGDNHSNFLSLYGRVQAKPEAIAHYQMLFNGDTVSIHGRLYAPSVYRGIGWDILPADRAAVQ